MTFSAPFMLNTNTEANKAQWQPNLSAASDGTLLAVWYDERERTAGSCQPSTPGTPCYRMWARKSTDNGLTWLPDEAFSDVVTPLPLQPDPGVVTDYAGDYDYGSALLTQHLSAWVDGRVALGGSSQQNAFVDRDPASTGGGIVLEARVKGQVGNHSVDLRWSPADGGSVNVLRNGAVVGTTADDGNVKNKLGATTGTFTYQVCETDSGDCSNEVTVVIP